MASKVSRRTFVTTTAVGAAGFLTLARRADAATRKPVAPLPAGLPLHNHWQKASYASSAEFPFADSQTHWGDTPDGHVSHVHIGCFAPLWAEIPRAPYTLDYKIQLFHLTGRVWGTEPGNPGGPFFGGFLATGVEWDRDDPIIGDPMGIVVRTCRVTYDPTVPYRNGAGGDLLQVPQNGWFPGHLEMFTQLENGPLLLTALRMPFYAKGDPNAPETNNERALAGFDFQLSARGSAFGNGHGTATAEYNDVYLPILAPIAQPVSAPGHTLAYARENFFPHKELDRWREVNDADLHSGIPGTTVKELDSADQSELISDVTFDPAVGPGAHKKALIWSQTTGPDGGAGFPAHQTLMSLLVVNYQVWDGAGQTPPSEPPPPPPPPPSASLYLSIQYIPEWGPDYQNGASVTVFGDLPLVRLTFAVDGGTELPATFDGSNWGRYLLLGPGLHTVVARAYDAGGHVIAQQSTTASR